LRPGIWGEGKIKCNSCNEDISDYWEQSNILHWLVLGILSVIVIGLLDFVWYLDMLYLSLYFLMVAVVFCLFMPLKKLANNVKKQGDELNNDE